MQNDIIHKLKNFVAREDLRIMKSFPNISEMSLDSRLALLELTRSIDYIYCRPLVLKQDNDEDIDKLYKAGSSHSVALFIDEDTNKYMSPLYPTSRESTNWADSCIQHSGRLVYLNNLLELSYDKIVSFDCVSDDHYKITLRSNDADIEFFDVADQECLRYFSSRQDYEHRKYLNDQTSFIVSEMENLVYPWCEHFIGYDTTPEIDTHFEEAGILWARTLNGQSELPGEAKIGGYPYYAYRAAVGIMCGRALKHLQYACILMGKCPYLDLRNLLTIWCEKRQLEEFFCYCLDINASTAKSLIKALTLNKEYVASFRHVPCAPLPPFIQISNDHLIMSLAGCLSAPFWFVLRKLRNNFRKDWDKIVGEREDIFRKDLYTVISLPYIQTVQNTVRIKHGGKELTDIDALAYDEKNGVLVLFQLKWQDPFGYSMQERRSRAKNLISEANRWVTIVHGWINSVSQKTIMSSLGLKLTSKINKVELVVLGRHHIRFTMGKPLSADAIWGTWPQFCRLVIEESEANNLLISVLSKLRKEQFRSQSPRFLAKTGDIMEIGKIKLEVQVT